MLSALVFVPKEYVVQYFEFVCDHNDFPPEVQPVIDYFEDTWISRPGRCLNHHHPRFDIGMWNYFDAAMNCNKKTNNCEEWRRGLSRLINASHPIIWKFLKALKDEQCRNEAKVEYFIAGEEPARSKKKCKSIASDFQNRGVLEYLCRIAQIIGS